MGLVPHPHLDLLVLYENRSCTHTEKGAKSASPAVPKMGQGASSSISTVKNDFELVVRATKELEWLLETKFGAPRDKTVGIHEKISVARTPTREPLPDNVKKRMRYLVTIRNQLVHERDVNAIPDKAAFAQGYQEVERELKAILGEDSSGCIVC